MMAKAKQQTDRLTCMTVNCDGKLNKGDKYPIKPASEVRLALIKPGLLECDVVFLQQIKCKSGLLELTAKDYETYMIRGSEEVGLFLKRERFLEGTIRFYRGAFFNTLVDEVNADHRKDGVSLDKSRFLFGKGQLRNCERVILFISYHGKYIGCTVEQRQTMCRMLMELSQKVKRHEAILAEYIIIGGDFNLEMRLCLDALKCAPKFTTTDYHLSLRRKNKYDYFILEDDITIKNTEPLQLIPNTLNISRDDLHMYLDHDPVITQVTVKSDSVITHETEKASSKSTKGRKREE